MKIIWLLWGVFYLYLPVDVRSEPCDDICEWTSWKSWSECSRTCGGYGLQRRYRGLCCDTSWSFDECLQHCSKDYSGRSESRQCGSTSCFNGGTVSYYGCNCLWNYQGYCCETERDHVSKPSGNGCNSDICNWTPWELWSSCTVPCGGGGTQQRERFLCCPDGYSYDTCLTKCGFPLTVSRFEHKSCGNTCFNGGTIKADQWGCDCLDRAFGHCCKEVLPGCLPYPTDIIFVLDSSASQTNMQFTRQLEFVKNFIDEVNVSFTEFQISVITYSWEAIVEIYFNQSESRDALKSLVDKIQFRPGVTNTHKGLREAMEVARKSERRKGMVTFSYVIVLTDGMSTERVETKHAAKELKSLNLRVIAIGICNQVSHQELRDISSPGDSNNPSYVFSVGDFNALDTMLKQLVHVTCDQCIRSYRSDLAFLIDDGVLTNDEFQIVVDVMTYMVRQMEHFGEDDGIRVAVTRSSTKLQTVTSLSEHKTLGEFLVLLQTLTTNTENNVCEKKDAVCESLNITASINYTFGELEKYKRENARQFIVIPISGRFQNIKDVNKEVSVLINQSHVKLFSIGPGPNVDMEGLLSLVNEANHVYSILENADLSNLDILQTEFSYNTCTKE